MKSGGTSKNGLSDCRTVGIPFKSIGNCDLTLYKARTWFAWVGDAPVAKKADSPTDSDGFDLSKAP